MFSQFMLNKINIMENIMANGNILCAQIAMVINGKEAMITCREFAVHVQISGEVGYTSHNIENWKNMSFMELRDYIEQPLE